MAKYVPDAYLNNFLNLLSSCTTMSVCSAQPSSHAGIASVTLASATITAGGGAGSYTIGDGAPDGRVLTVLQKTSVSVISSGDATHVARTDGTNIVVTTCTTQTLTAGGTVTINEYGHTIRDVT